MSLPALRPATLVAMAMIEVAAPAQATEAEPARCRVDPCGSAAPEALSGTVESVLRWVASRRPSLLIEPSCPPSCAVQNLRLEFSRPPLPRHGEAAATYDPQLMAVALPCDWDRRDPSDMGLLVHELVHVLQAAGGSFDQCGPDCRRRLERQAYAVQARWLDEHGHPVLALLTRITGMYVTEPAESFTYR